MPVRRRRRRRCCCGVVPHSSTAQYGHVMFAWVRAGRLDKIRETLETMERDGIAATVFHYNTIIDGFGKGNRLDEARAPSLVRRS
jgi:pentatricopeptide repeat protein